MVSLRLLPVFAVLLAAVLPAPAQKPKPPAAPKSLLIYYGYPSLINGANNQLLAAQKEFAKYDYVVLGGGLEDPKHDNHAFTARLIADTPKIQFFGYVDVGVSTSNFTPQQIAAKVGQWGKMKVKGVLLDDFGFDFKVDRKRQNDAVKAVHDLKLRVIANAWKPEDAFAPDNDGVPTALTKDDIYLWESYRFKMGEAVSAADWRAKADTIEKLRKDTGIPFEVFAVSTTKKEPAPKDLTQFFGHLWYCAVIDGHAAVGWGHPSFSAINPSQNAAPYLPPPVQRLGTATDRVDLTGPVYKRQTSLGTVEANADKLTGRFVPKK